MARDTKWRSSRLAEHQFDVFLTMDRSISFQQSVAGLAIAVVVIRARSNRPDELRRLIPEIERAVSETVAGTATSVGDWPPPAAGSPST